MRSNGALIAAGQPVPCLARPRAEALAVAGLERSRRQRHLVRSLGWLQDKEQRGSSATDIPILHFKLTDSVLRVARAPMRAASIQ